METRTAPSFAPDFAVPPGETLLETLETLGLSQSELAERTGRPKKTINEIIKGKAAITPETAIQLERVLGVPAAFWVNLEQNHRTTLARLAERKKLSECVEWLKTFPIKQMIEFGWIRKKDDKIGLVQEVLSFFGVASPDAWKNVSRQVREAVAFRQSKAYAPDLGAVAAWLRQGEIQGRKVECEPFDPKIFRQVLDDIRLRTVDDPKTFYPMLRENCATAGVSLAIVKQLPKLRVSGAARWLSPTRPMIELSLYYKKNDFFWFAFFHEAGHILLHGKKDLFVDIDLEGEDAEAEANAFAANILIPKADYEAFLRKARFTANAIERFAKRLGIAPGIVVGRLQHDKIIDFSECSELKESVESVLE